MRPYGKILMVLAWIFSAASLQARERFQMQEPESWVGGYNSLEGGVEEPSGNGRRATIYTMEQIKHLRKAISPRYVRVLDWEEYGRSQGLVRGILVTYPGYRKKNVSIAGDFNGWNPVPMARNEAGVYFIIIKVREDEKGHTVDRYRYKFLVDDLWTYDRTNRDVIDDGMGGYLSQFILEDRDVNRQATVRVLPEISTESERVVEFQIYLPSVKNLMLVGSFNDWNPEHDFLRKGEDGVFRLRKRLRPGSYTYKYLADGKWILDKYQSETRFDKTFGDLASYINVP